MNQPLNSRSRPRLVTDWNYLLLAVVIACLVMSRERVSGQEVCSPLVRASLSSQSLQTGSGTKLKLDPAWQNVTSAWSGFIIEETGGPHRTRLAKQHRQQAATVLAPDALPDDGLSEEERADEQAARARHLNNLHVKYFDTVLLELQRDSEADPQYLWITDYDIDGDLSDEVAFLAQSVDSTGRSAGSPSARAIVDVLRTSEAGMSFRFRNRMRDAQPGNNASTRDQTAGQTRPSSVRLPEHSNQYQSLYEELCRLDDVRVRKEQLPQIIEAATELIEAIDQLPNSAEHRDLLAEALYRRGRALGYRELPDVVLRYPVEDPDALNEAFEANFRRLDALVDTRQPEYVLLRIRRERRRGCRGRALNLVERYRTSHPTPVWHFKKRMDLLNELGTRLAGHQATAELWLHGSQPRHPVLTVFRTARSAESTHAVITWPADVHRPSISVRFFASGNAASAVVWLPDEGSLPDGYEATSDTMEMWDAGLAQPIRCRFVEIISTPI